MKKLLLLIPLIVSSFLVFAQPKVTRSTGANTVMDTRLGAIKNFLTPVYSDTSVASQIANIGIDSCGAQIFTYDVMGLWVRACNPKRWIRIGSVTALISSNSILVSGAGTDASPYIPTLIPSAQSGNIIQIFPDGVFATTQTQIQNGLISGGLVIWQTGLTYIVTAATYAINGVIYNSPETTITLDAADLSDPRIDGFVVTTSNTAIDLTGTPNADPANPSYDPATQLPLTFVLISTAMTEPVFCRDSIYFPNNGQTWAGAVSNATRINLTSTNNPYSITQDIEFTAAQNNDQLRLTKSTVISWGTYSVLVLKVRSKGAWPANSRVNIRMYNGLTPLGINVALGDGIFGFNSSITNVYQTIAIPLPNLGNVTSPDNILFSVSTTGANTIGFHLDDIELLGCAGTPIPVTGRFWSQGGDRWGTTGVIGTLDNFPMQHVVNNTNHLILNTNGTMGMQGTNPGVSFQLNSFGAADYSIRRVGTDLITNTAGTILNRFQGNTVYSFDKTNGHIWADSLATFRMQLNPNGNLLLGTNANNANTIFNISSTTKGSHPAPSMTAVQMNAIVTPLTGDLVFNSTANSHYYFDGTIWRSLSHVITASNGLTISGADDVKLGGTLIQNTTITTAGFSTTFTDVVGTAVNVVAITSATQIPLSITATASTAINIVSAGATGLQVNTSATGVNAFGTTLGITGNSGLGGMPMRARNNANDNNAVLDGLSLARTGNSVVGAAGIGIRQLFQIRNSVSGIEDAGYYVGLFTDATDGSEDAAMEWHLMTAGALAARKMLLNSTGVLTLDNYGDGNLTAGTATFAAAWDANGNFMEIPIGGGAGDVTKVGTPVNNQLGVWTGNGTIEGDPNLTFTASTLTIGVATSAKGVLVLSGNTSGTVTIQPLAAAGGYTLTLPPDDGTSGQILSTDGAGVLTWVTAAGGGTVTTLSVVTANGFAGTVANPTTTPSITITTSITGLLKGNGTAISAAVSGTDYLPAIGGTSITTLGTITTGTWNGTVIGATFGGTGQTSWTTGDVPYASATNTISKRAAGSNGQVFTMVAGVPQWVTPGTGGTVTNFSFVNLNGFTGSVTNSATTPALTIGTSVNGIMQGNGTGASAITNSSTVGQVLRVIGVSSYQWGALDLANSSAITGALLAGNGGTGVGGPFTNGFTLIGNGTGWTKAAITAGQGIIVTPGAGSITISSDYARAWITVVESGSTINWNTTTGANARVTLNGANRTLNIQNPIDGYVYTLRVIQGSGGSRTISTWTNVKWPNNGTLPTLSNVAGQYDIFQFKYEASTNFFYGSIGLNYN